MPIWLEVIVILLVAYGLGLAMGWFAWGRSSARRAEIDERDSE